MRISPEAGMVSREPSSAAAVTAAAAAAGGSSNMIGEVCVFRQ